MSTATLMAVPQVAVSSSSVACNTAGFRTNLAVSRRTVQPLSVRAVMDGDQSRPTADPRKEDKSNIGDKIKEGLNNISQGIQDKMPAGTQPGGPNRKPGDEWQQVSSTGELNPDKLKQAAKSGTDNLMEKVQDAGRTLKSKTDTIVSYADHRNAADIPDNITEKNIEAQKKYTDSK